MPAHPPKSLTELASLLDAEILGDGTVTVTDVAHPAMAARADVLALAMDKGSFAALAATKARAAIVERGSELDLTKFDGGLAVGRGRLALAKLLRIFARPPHAVPGIHPSAVVEDGARIGADASIGAFAYVGPEAEIGAGAILMSHASVGAGARIGDNALLHAGARVGERCVVGARVIIHMNASIGADGFGYVTPEPGSVEAARKGGKVDAVNLEIIKINTIGNVTLGDDVEIGANCAIDSGTLGPTAIGTGTKIDNLVQIGHNCRIGENCLIAGQVGIAGSTQIGDRVVIAGGAGIGDHRKVGNDAIILPKSGVGQDVPPREIWGGYPAAPKDDKAEELMNIARIKRLIRDVRNLQADVAALRK
jgi:UDP-3-O-[3-hydroxymyristoyl] glucosamine N-acyltransferase